ncbi:MAG: ABC transporter ATP-binding protein [Eubacteriales bacterium]|nr:ABC transporter ATP-binding protein [Eubacteriales bacterium]MDD4582584.1 ABC transporter ATP-binding protein [Eubacteriales bacterium]
MYLQVIDLMGGYGKRTVLYGISFGLNPGDILCVLGPNGSGKTTLLKLLLRFIPKTNGQVLLEGKDTIIMNRTSLAKSFAYIPQSDRILFPYTVLEMVTLGRTCHIGQWKTPSKEDVDIAYQALKKVRIAHMADRIYTKLSGGERQLVLIARALCQNAGILIMDEPTSSLDFANQQLIMNAVDTSAKEGRIIILTTHSPSQPFTIATKALLLSKGRMVGFGDPYSVLTNQSLEDVYGIPMDILSITDRNQNCRTVCLPIH